MVVFLRHSDQRAFQDEIRGREAMLSPLFRDYLAAARCSSPEPAMTPMTMDRFLAMCARARPRTRKHSRGNEGYSDSLVASPARLRVRGRARRTLPESDP